MNAWAKFQPGVDTGMTAGDWIWGNGKLHVAQPVRAARAFEMTMDACHSDLQAEKLHVAQRVPSVRAGLALRSDDESFLVRTSS
jgi:hypothetical protein